MTIAARRRQAGLAGLGIPLEPAPMEAKLVTELPKDGGWQFELKWDGFRCLAFRAGGNVEIKSKSGKSLSRFFPEVLENMSAVSPSSFVLDGELVIPVDGVLSFDALQMRLHPAESRIGRLSNETPATFIVFDCLLRKARQPLLPEPFEARRAALEAVFEWHHRGCDGAVETRAMIYREAVRVSEPTIETRRNRLPNRSKVRSVRNGAATLVSQPAVTMVPVASF